MTRVIPEQELARVISLLETLREDEALPRLNVEMTVARRIRLLLLPRPWAPLVTLRQFGWAAAAAVAMLAFGALGLLGVFGVAGASVPATSLGQSLRELGGAVVTTILIFAKTILWGIIEATGRLLGSASRLDGAMDVAGQLALVVCALMIILTVLVVTHETYSRRFTA